MTLADETPPRPNAEAGLDRLARQTVVAALAEAMRVGYVEPQIGIRAAERIEQALAAGAYEPFRDRLAFAARLTADLSEIAHDKHLRVFGDGAPPPAHAPPSSEAGVVRADRLDGNVGYIEIVGFPPSEVVKPPLDRAMTALADSQSLIIDMRRNRGGHPSGVAYLVSFFVSGEAPILVMDFLWRKPGTADYQIDQTFTTATPVSYLTKPIFLLISSQTFSGGEEFAYDMQAMKLATLIGETTAGGANPGMSRPLAAGLGMVLPSGKPRHPLTGANWDGVGVIPDIVAAPDHALKVALERLGRRPEANEIDALSRGSLFIMRETALPGAEAALRGLIEDVAGGRPDYESMSTAFAGVVRSQLANVQPLLTALGPIQSIRFSGPGFAGDDFEVRFASGALLCSIGLTCDGKVASLFRTPLPTPQ